MKRRLAISAVAGLCLALVFMSAAYLLPHFFTYTDKPGMWNPLVFRLLPGLLTAGRLFDNRWVSIGMVLVVHSLLYGFAVFCLLCAWDLVSKAGRATL